MPCATRSSELDGVFTYLVATADSLGMAKDTMAAKPMVLYESDDFIALASEEVAIRSVFPHEIDTSTPTTGEVRRMAELTRPNDQRPGISLRWACTRAALRPDHAGFFSATRGGELRLSRRLRCRLQQARRIRRRPAVDAREINLKIRELMQQGYGTIVVHNPLREALARRRHPEPAQPALRGQPRLFRLRPDRRAQRPHQGPGRLVAAPRTCWPARVVIEKNAGSSFAAPRCAAATWSARATSAGEPASTRRAAPSSSAAAPARFPAS